MIFEREFISIPEVLPEIEDYVVNTLKNIDLTEDILDPLTLSVAEAASNSILHGNKNNPDKKVKITVIICKDLIRIKFLDEGDGFDPDKVPDPTAPENILKDSGRGLHIMNTFLDKLSYNFTSKGTEAILEIKY